jgi:sigma-B regulation protein RsbU (phosphoserine phosphatase)
MAEPSAERLALLYRISQTFNSSLDLDQVLKRVMDEVIAATRAERGFLMLRDPDGQLTFRTARGIEHQTLTMPEFQVSRGVVERVAREGQPRLTSDAQHETWLSARQSVISMGLRSILCVPLLLRDTTLGVIYVDNRWQTGIFTPDDLELLSAIASSAAIAIENARLYQVAVEKGRMERELQVARELQTSLIPRETPQFTGWDFAALWQPAREVSGDFYDFPPVGAEKVGIVIADVSDKGMPAALFMALARSTVRASVAHAPSPADAITQANKLVCADAANGMFVSLFYGQLDPATGQIIYVNAGHNPPLLYRAADDTLTELGRTGVLLGVDESLTFEQRSLRLDPGDFILLYTDGVTEAADAQSGASQEFGGDRLRRVLLAHRRAGATQIVAALAEAITSFVGATPQWDDITVVMVKRVEGG